MRKQAQRDLTIGQHQPGRRPNPRRSRATLNALKHEGRSAGSRPPRHGGSGFEGGAERRFGCRLVADLALFVKVNRRPMQFQQQTRSLVWLGLMPEIFIAEFGKAEFFLPGDFPQEIEVDFAGNRLCLA